MANGERRELKVVLGEDGADDWGLRGMDGRGVDETVLRY